ncbi:hypothetical protein ACMU_03605 [Actibacterium mucosum KCTC 23349]|uniref:DUF2842 domain-containing protein n=1 Tax=Actibacterium mucosum KCTC 23349 TaxID=1454373 RepID=A0A037ZF63_9RHOB|nr:DUF2842 domain-containing protein [Actibacterium mucosum]KAJ54181.1 hypothetical protein ACMU_03605 [Actibacterium mucosum KCTC 23349]
MALSYKARRRWALVVLLIGLPVYIVLAVTLTDWLRERFDGLNFLVELLIFVVLGFLWMLPLRSVFLGVGKADPDAPLPPDQG